MENYNKIMVDYLLQYPLLQSYLYFNTSTDIVGNTSIRTVSSNTWERRFLRGKGIKNYDFAVVCMTQQDTGTSDVNVTEVFNVEKFMKWIDEQNKNKNFPDFGEGIKILSIENLQNMPSFGGTNEAGNIAEYLFQVRVRYSV